MTAVQLHNEVRLLSKPQWFRTYLFDLIATKRIHLCKPLSRPEAALLASCWRQLKPTAKRQKIEEAAEEQYNPKVMHDGLFQQLKFTPCRCQVACGLGSILGRVKSGGGMLGRHALAVLGDLDRHARSLAAKPVSASCWR